MAVSVLIPARNAETTIVASVKSALRQVGSDGQVLLFDDASTDGTRRILQTQIPDRRLVVITNREHKAVGVANALNTLIDATKTEYFARLDADDVFAPFHLKISHWFLRSNEADIVGAQMFAFPVPRLKTYPLGQRNIIERLVTRNAIAHPTVFARKNSIDVERYRDIILVEDYDFWCRLVLKGLKILNSPHLGVFYRQHALQQTKNTLTLSATQKIAETYRPLFLAHFPWLRA
jgi:glycosyltransferase involved in cell wall biosynthesis